MTDLNSHGMGIPFNLCSDRQKSGAMRMQRDVIRRAIVEMATDHMTIIGMSI